MSKLTPSLSAPRMSGVQENGAAPRQRPAPGTGTEVPMQAHSFSKRTPRLPVEMP